MVGVADPQDPSKYPELKDEFCHFSVVVGGSGGRSVSCKASCCKMTRSRNLINDLPSPLIISGAPSVLLVTRSVGH
jgi:hypothetical protein